MSFSLELLLGKPGGNGMAVPAMRMSAMKQHSGGGVSLKVGQYVAKELFLFMHPTNTGLGPE
jgi:hypothetical protein